MKILGIGNALVDVLAKLENDTILSQLDLPKGSMQLIDETKRNHIFTVIEGLPQRRTAGGCASNTLCALAKMGLPAGFIGKIGSDDYGKLYKEDVCGIGVNTHLIEEGAASGTAMTMISPDGERTFGTYLGVSGNLSVGDLSPDTFRQYDCLYVEGYLVQNYELIESAMQMAKKQGMKVAIDAASYNVIEENRDFFLRLIDEYVDILFANEEESGALTRLAPKEAVEALAERVEIAVVKVGAKGAWAMRGDEVINAPAIPANMTDATAAGDFFAAGFLYGLSHGKDLRKCAETGAWFASHIIEVVGTRLDDKTWEKIKEGAKKILSSSSLN